MLETTLTLEVIDTIDAILIALHDDSDDSVSWLALADIVEEQGESVEYGNGRDIEGVFWRAHLAQRAYAMSARTRQGRSAVECVELHSSYAETGYSGNAIATGNWNDITHYESGCPGEAGHHQIDDRAPSRFGALLSALGVECEWADEWASCHECGGMVRTSPDCYSWIPSYRIINDCELLCLGCAPDESSDDEQDDE